MANRLFTKVFGTRFDRELKRIQPIVDAIKQHEVRLKDLSDSELQAQTAKFRERITERTGTLLALYTCTRYFAERLPVATSGSTRRPICCTTATLTASSSQREISGR